MVDLSKAVVLRLPLVEVNYPFGQTFNLGALRLEAIASWLEAIANRAKQATEFIVRHFQRVTSSFVGVPGL